MRKLLSLHHLNGILSSPAPPPPPPSLQFPDFSSGQSFVFSSIPIVKCVFDVATISSIAGLLLLSFICFSAIFYLRLRARRVQHLENFNYLWTVRLLLVLLASFWSANEILRLPFVRRNYLYPFLPSISLPVQAKICQVHIVLSLGFYEPGFLITLIFLVNVSIKKRKPNGIWALVSLLVVCSPITLLQAIFVFFSPLEGRIVPRFMQTSSSMGNDQFGNRTVLCTFPFFSGVVFGVFAAVYAIAFLLSCWRVQALVINKGIRKRINLLAAAVMGALSVQILCISLSWVWDPEDAGYGFVVLAMFLIVSGSMAVGEIILVLKPITDALAADADLRRRPAEAVDTEETSSSKVTSGGPEGKPSSEVTSNGPE